MLQSCEILNYGGNSTIIISKMMDLLANFPSSEEISFKLTQNLIPSFGNSKGTLIPLESSLQYTFSRISIQHMLQEDAIPPLQSIQKLDAETFSKNSSLKASSINTGTDSDVKHTPRATFRDRKVSGKKTSLRTSLEKGSSFHVFEFDQEKTTMKASLIHSEPKKSKSEIRRKCKSARRETTMAGSLSDVKTLHPSHSKRVLEQSSILLDLKKSMHIKQIKLRADEERERNYLKRILQNRMCSLHPNDDISNSVPLWTSRKMGSRF